MLTSKRQEWILEMIKGPDIFPVDNRPGHYASKSTISVTVDEKQVIIKPVDVLDFSNPQFLIVRSGDRECSISWDKISGLDFEEESVPAASPRARVKTFDHTILHFPVGKKAV
jgi:hypothetical protein